MIHQRKDMITDVHSVFYVIKKTLQKPHNEIFDFFPIKNEYILQK